MEPTYTQLPERSFDKVALVMLSVLLYIPTIIIFGRTASTWIENGTSIALNFRINTQGMLMMFAGFIIMIIIPLFIAKGIKKGYQKRKNVLLIIAILAALIWVGGWAFLGWKSYIAGPLEYPPVCKEGYGYTTSIGPTDLAVYSRCRKGPNIDNYPNWGTPVINF